MPATAKDIQAIEEVFSDEPEIASRAEKVWAKAESEFSIENLNFLVTLNTYEKDSVFKEEYSTLLEPAKKEIKKLIKTDSFKRLMSEEGAAPTPTPTPTQSFLERFINALINFLNPTRKQGAVGLTAPKPESKPRAEENFQKLCTEFISEEGANQINISASTRKEILKVLPQAEITPENKVLKEQIRPLLSSQPCSQPSSSPQPSSQPSSSSQPRSKRRP